MVEAKWIHYLYFPSLQPATYITSHRIEKIHLIAFPNFFATADTKGEQKLLTHQNWSASTNSSALFPLAGALCLSFFRFCSAATSYRTSTKSFLVYGPGQYCLTLCCFNADSICSYKCSHSGILLCVHQLIESAALSNRSFLRPTRTRTRLKPARTNERKKTLCHLFLATASASGENKEVSSSAATMYNSKAET